MVPWPWGGEDSTSGAGIRCAKHESGGVNLADLQNGSGGYTLRLLPGQRGSSQGQTWGEGLGSRC